MKCTICGKTSDDRRAVIGAGIVCPDCATAAQQRRRELHATLLAEDLADMPDVLDMAAFERLVLKYALHFMRDILPEQRDAVLRANPAFIIPEELALWAKDRILQEIPHQYLSFTQVRVHDRIFPRGEYRFVKQIPARIMYAAMRKAKLVKETKSPTQEHTAAR